MRLTARPRRLATLSCLIVFTSSLAAPRMPREVVFTETPASATDRERAETYTRSRITLLYEDGSERTLSLEYRVLFRSGDLIGPAENAWPAGRIVDAAGVSIEEAEGVEEGRPDGKPGIRSVRGPFDAVSPDANTLIRRAGGLHLLTHYEFTTRAPATDAQPSATLQLPMVVELARLAQDPDTGVLSATSLENVDVRSIGGIWTPCAASLTLWNTHLGGEEFEPNARLHGADLPSAMRAYYGADPVGLPPPSPYRYGFPVEISVDEHGSARVRKRYALGRLSVELADVMPDGKTVYLADDAENGVRVMFVADRAGDLSSGTLYAARWEQTNAHHGGAADLRWIRLGHASEDEVRSWIDARTIFDHIFERREPAGEPPPGFVAVKVYPGTPFLAYPGSPEEDPALEHLRVREGAERKAAFLETRRYAAMLGATAEFNKMEGLAHSERRRKLYTAISKAEGGMLRSGPGPVPDHITLDPQGGDLACGAVYESDLMGGQSAWKPGQDGRLLEDGEIDSDWVAVNMRAVLRGRDAWGPVEQQGFDTCDTGSIANPDNLAYSEATGLLFVAEDSDRHLNNALWAFTPGRDAAPMRILSAPAGAEISGLHVVENEDGHGYLFANLQHPGSVDDLEPYREHPRCRRSEVCRAMVDGLVPRIDPRGVVGYLVLPSLRGRPSLSAP